MILKEIKRLATHLQIVESRLTVPPDRLTVEEVERYYDIKRSRLYRLSTPNGRAAKVRRYKVGGRVYFDRGDIERLLEGEPVVHVEARGRRGGG